MFGVHIREVMEAFRKSAEQNRPQDSESRRLLLERVHKVWDAAPELRLGQLICNVFSDPYSVEDFDLIDTLETRYLDKSR